MLRNRSNILPTLVLLAIMIATITNCSTVSEIRTPESTLESTPTITQAPMPSPSEQASSIPTREPIPAGLIRIPVPESAEQTAAELLEADHPPADLYRLAIEVSNLPKAQLIPEIPENSQFEINNRENFIFSRQSRYYTLPARLRHISDNAYWWTNLDARASDEEIYAAAQRFEDEILKINQLAFGKEWSPGIDNDRRIHIVLVEDEDSSPYGYFSLINEFPVSIQPNSNQKEIIFLRLKEVDLDSLEFAGRLAHEYQHMIQWNLDPNEDYWLNEGMSELAYYLSGAPPNTKRKNKAKYSALMPDNQLTSWPELRFGDEDRTALAQYGAGKQFLVYLFEQFGAKFIKDLANNPAPGVLSIQEELNKLPDQPQFHEVYANWLVAKFVNRSQLSQGEFGYREFPVNYFPVTELVKSLAGIPFTDRLPPYGARYYLIEVSEPVKVNFSGSTLARLTPADPPTGEFVWYSNRGDASNFNLTRSFDLTEVDTATLNYKVWYQLDDNYDYAYVEVSTDGGQTWEILTTAYGTVSNTQKQSLGIGYSGSINDWLDESIDLTSYAGQEIQLRFELVSDFTINRDGIQIDDIGIPEIGYFDSAEDDSGGWGAQGFIRSSNLVPVEWIVWLIKASNPFQVERITLTPEQMAEFEIQGFGEQFNVAAVVVSPTAPTTTMELDYELVFQHP